MKKSPSRYVFRSIFSTLTVLVMLLSPFAVGAETANPAPPAAPMVGFGNVSKTDNPGQTIPIDGTTYPVYFNVLPGDVMPGASITEVWVDIEFYKTSHLNADCAAGPGPGPDLAEEIGFTLLSPGLAFGSVQLVTPTDLLLPPQPPNGYASQTPDLWVWPVPVTFDDDGIMPVTGMPIIPSGPVFQSTLANLNTFDNNSPVGQWILELSDMYPWMYYPASPNLLCYVSSTLHIDYQYNQVDLSIEKYPSDATMQFNNLVMAGQEMFWTIRGWNSGGDTALNARVYDYLPPQFIFLGAEANCISSSPPSSPPPLPPGGTWYVCSLGDIPPDGYFEFHIKTLVSPDAVALVADGTLTLPNFARIESDAEELNPGDNDAWGSVFVEDLADLRVTKMSKPDTEVLAGEPFTYTIYVDNLGPSFSRFPWVQDKILSSGDFTLDSFVSNRFADCEVTDVGFDCMLWDPLEPQGYIPGDPPPERWTIQVQVTANQTQDINNEVNVFTIDDPDSGYYGTPDPDMSNNQAIDFISVLDVADLSLVKSNEVEPIGGDPWVPFGSATAGLSIRYTLTIANDGPSTAENMLLEDKLPFGVTLEPGTLTVNGTPGEEFCTTGTPGDPLEPLTCGLGELLPGAEPSVVTFVVKVDPSVAEGTILENDAWVTSDIFDPDNSDDYAFNQTYVMAFADLGITKYAEAVVWYAGEDHNYYLDVTNSGPSLARDVVVMDWLPSRVEFISASLDTGEEFVPADCEMVSQDYLVCHLGDLQPSHSKNLIIKVHILPGDWEEIENDAAVYSVTSDYAPENNNASVTWEVLSYVDLAITKSAPQHVYAGEEMFYDITVTNVGATSVHSVTVGDQLPMFDEYEPLVMYLGSTGDVDEDYGDDCSFDDEYNEVYCDLYFDDDLDPGESFTFQIKVLVRPDLMWLVEDTGFDGTYEMLNVAWLDIYDDNYENNYSEAVTIVEDQADLRVIKMSKPDTEVRAGEIFTYTILVDNLGPSSSRGVTIQDNILSSGDFTVIDIIDDRPYILAPEGYPARPTNPDWTSMNCFMDGDSDGPESPEANQMIMCSLFIFPLEPQGWYPEDWSPPAQPSPQAPMQDEPLSGRWTIQIVVQANEAQDINNIVDVYTINIEEDGDFFLRGTPDPDMSNNQAIDFISVLASSDLELTKSVVGEYQWVDIFLSDTKVSRSLPLTYTLLISNTGASTAENVVLQDNLPVEPEITSMITSQGRCFKGTPGDLSRPMTCYLGTILPGTGVTVTVATIVPMETELGTIIYNEAWIDYTDTFDPDNSNNMDAREIEVVELVGGVAYIPVVLNVTVP